MACSPNGRTGGASLVSVKRDLSVAIGHDFEMSFDVIRTVAVDLMTTSLMLSSPMCSVHAMHDDPLSMATTCKMPLTVLQAIRGRSRFTQHKNALEETSIQVGFSAVRSAHDAVRLEDPAHHRPGSEAAHDACGPTSWLQPLR